ncbi:MULTISPECIES: lasso peptide biosynthesis B2 protein [unclassified Pseudonocardia]|uniref:lasso peptide biosynthesis B2 protein n=1 Tax=Pseudonocardia sp. P1 TaxID=761194 RepID=UPI0009F90CBD
MRLSCRRSETGSARFSTSARSTGRYAPMHPPTTDRPSAHELSRLVRLVRAAARVARRPAHDAHVVAVLHCVCVIGRVSAFRTACLEETVAAMLALAVNGRRAGWCHGIAADPIRLHAWLRLDGCPSASPPPRCASHH